MLLGEYSVRTGKTPQQHKSTYTIDTRHSHRGSESGPASSHAVPHPLIRRWSDPLDRLAVQSKQRRVVGTASVECQREEGSGGPLYKRSVMPPGHCLEGLLWRMCVQQLAGHHLWHLPNSIVWMLLQTAEQTWSALCRQYQGAENPPI